MKPYYSLSQIQQNLSSIKIISKHSKFFPKNLKELPDCPEMIFVLGNECILNQTSISIVGTRNSSEDGNHIAYSFSKDLAEQNIIIVSGFANGIDTYSHLGAISSGNTIAILAYGFQWISHKNITLAQKILKKGGALISEYFPDICPQKFSFLKRNRLIASISIGVIVVEAPQKSGALNTVSIAKKLNKPIFAVPWNITTFRGAGSNLLLQNDAILLTNSSQIINYFRDSSLLPNNSFFPFNKNLKNTFTSTHEKGTNTSISKEYEALYHFIFKHSPVSKNEIYSHFPKESIANLNAKLILMELQNLICLKNNFYNII